jgi:hypothetical protein
VTSTSTATPTPAFTLTPTATFTATASPTSTPSPTATATPTYDPYDLSGDGYLAPEDLFFLGGDKYFHAGRDEIYLLDILRKIRNNREREK